MMPLPKTLTLGALSGTWNHNYVLYKHVVDLASLLDQFKARLLLIMHYWLTNLLFLGC